MIDRSALETFVEAIAVFGLGLADIEEHEASGEVALEATCDGSHLKGLTREQRCAAVRPWPGDTTVEVWLDDALREHVFDEVGAPLPDAIDDDANYTIRVNLTKAAAATAALPGAGQVVWYLTAAALIRDLTDSLDATRVRLWDDDDQPTTVAVSEVDCDLRGPMFRVLGGRLLAGPPTQYRAPWVGIAPCLLDQIRHRAEADISHDRDWGRRLTPHHLLINEVRSADDGCAEFLRAVNASFVALFCLFSCDRARTGKKDAIRAEYRSTSHVTFLNVEAVGQLDADPQQLDALRDIIDWVYNTDPPDSQRDWTAERLQLVQIRIAENQHQAGPDDRVRALIEGAGELNANVRWGWRHFLADTLDGYAQKVHEFDAEIGSAISSFGDRASSIAKQVTNTMLAAVAAVIGSFIGAAFSGNFNADVFVIGIYAYAGYVVIFPGVLGSTSHGMQYIHARDHYELRRKRFCDILTQQRVNEIEADRVSKAKRLFVIVFVVSLLAYIGVAVGAYFAAQVVPDVVSDPAPATQGMVRLTTMTGAP